MSYHLPILASDIPANKLLELNPGDYFKTGDALDLSKHIKQKDDNSSLLKVLMGSLHYKKVIQKVWHGSIIALEILHPHIRVIDYILFLGSFADFGRIGGVMVYSSG